MSTSVIRSHSRPVSRKSFVISFLLWKRMMPLRPMTLLPNRGRSTTNCLTEAAHSWVTRELAAGYDTAESGSTTQPSSASCIGRQQLDELRSSDEDRLRRAALWADSTGLESPLLFDLLLPFLFAAGDEAEVGHELLDRVGCNFSVVRLEEEVRLLLGKTEFLEDSGDDRLALPLDDLSPKLLQILDLLLEGLGLLLPALSPVSHGLEGRVFRGIWGLRLFAVSRLIVCFEGAKDLLDCLSHASPF